MKKKETIEKSYHTWQPWNLQKIDTSPIASNIHSRRASKIPTSNNSTQLWINHIIQKIQIWSGTVYKAKKRMSEKKNSIKITRFLRTNIPTHNINNATKTQRIKARWKKLKRESALRSCSTEAKFSKSNSSRIFSFFRVDDFFKRRLNWSYPRPNPGPSFSISKTENGLACETKEYKEKGQQNKK